MSTASPFLVLNCDCDHAIRWFTNQLANANLTVLRTFNSKDVRSLDTECLCPHHGANLCNCQVSIFLVYRSGLTSPVSVIVNGYDQYSLFFVVDTPQQRADAGLEAKIRSALIPMLSQVFTQVGQDETNFNGVGTIKHDPDVNPLKENLT